MTDSAAVSSGLVDRRGRTISLRPVDAENWRAIADVTARDDQRDFTAALAARYLLLTTLEDTWSSFGVYADEQVVGHLMWGIDDDGSHWIGGVMVDAAEQGSGVGRAAMRTLIRWLSDKPACDVIRLSYVPANAGAAALYAELGFVPTGETDGDETVVELRV